MTDRDYKPQTQVVEPEHASRPPEAQPPVFRAIFLAECSYVSHSLRRLGVRERDLEDLTHDVFLVVHRHLHDYDPARPLKPWLFGICVRVALGDRRRARHRLEEVDGSVDAVDERPPADEQIAAAETRELVIAALGAIDPERCAVFVMHDIDEIPMPEIALALTLPLNTAYSRLRLARREFAAAVKRLRARRGEP